MIPASASAFSIVLQLWYYATLPVIGTRKTTPLFISFYATLSEHILPRSKSSL
ncbi:hypothetical protein F5Y00DRAFT_244474 [Daldinia vernicosa]|uniref:uncharacterized protein n=1 Tax=Daldinia vernicosa TaxID=114800 RepID=UPI0020089FE1|nr:uncharacterized protein F5Y00DRAFT_244474 [Daldinia vernicosa]KAI0846261.1 hypothetical protein F5Y00DRAFT_244474 [Daldinia vernicosa]